MELLESWHEEKRSAYLYEILAEKELDPTRQKLFKELAGMATKQAELWEIKIKKSNLAVPSFKPDFRTYLVGFLLKLWGPKPIKFILSAMKVRGMSLYLDVEPKYPFKTSVTHEARHKNISTAGNLRAAVFGVNDGLISNMSLVLGIAGATVDHNIIILSGIAGLLAGACSMGAGEYISVRSQKEFYEYQIELERQELQQYPEEEMAELAAIYRARGLPNDEAENLAKIILDDPEQALDTLAREELGLNPKELGSPWGAAISSFFSFCGGAVVPLIPFFLGAYRYNLLIAILLTAIALFTVGTILSLFTNCNALKSGLRMLLIGAAAGTFTYLIGVIVGVSIH